MVLTRTVVVHRRKLVLTIKCVPVDINLGIEAVNIAFRSHDQRIDFQKRTVELFE